MSSAEIQIRAIRDSSNRAIAEGDLIGVAASLANDFIVIIGDGSLLDREAYIEAFAHMFRQPERLNYERIADSIQVSTAQALAAEHGHWIGRLAAKHPHGEVLCSGTYMAMWRFVHSQWELRSELFVSLA